VGDWRDASGPGVAWHIPLARYSQLVMGSWPKMAKAQGRPGALGPGAARWVLAPACWKLGAARQVLYLAVFACFLLLLSRECAIALVPALITQSTPSSTIMG